MKKTYFVASVSLFLSGFATLSSQAAQKWWDGNGSTAGAGTTPTGTWGTSPFWTTTSDGTGTPGAWTAGDDALFSAGTDATGTYTVTISGTQTAGNITHEEGAITLSGGTGLNIGGGVSGKGIIDVAASRTLTISAVIPAGSGDNTGRLTKNNSGTLVLSGNNLFTGGLTINDGVLSHNGESASLAGSASASGAIPASTIANYITLNGQTAVFQGTRTGVGVTFLATAKGITLNGGGTLEVTDTTASDLNIYGGVIAGTGPLIKSGGGVLSLTGLSTYSGSTIINNGTLRIRTTGTRLPTTTDLVVNSPGIFDVVNLGQTVASLTGNGAVTATTGLGLIVAGSSSPAAFTGVMSGTGSLSHTGTGTLTLGGVNTYSGKFTNTTGVVTVNASGSLCGAVCDLWINGGTVNLNNVTQGVEDLNGTSASATLNLNGTALTVGSVTACTYSGVIAGTGSFIKNGTTTLTLTAINTYNGNTTISAGAIAVDGDSTFGNGVGTLNLSGGNVVITADRGSTANNIQNPINMTANTEFQSSGTSGTRNLVFGGSITASAGTLTLHQNNGAAGTGVLDVRLTNSFTFARPITFAVDAAGNSVQLSVWNTATIGDQTYSGLISGPGSIRRSATTSGTGGKTTFTAANTYSGGTSLNDGEIAFGISSTGPADAPTSGPIGTGILSIGSTKGKMSASGGTRIVGNHVSFNSTPLIVGGAADLELSGNIDLSTSAKTLQVDNAGVTTISGSITNGSATGTSFTKTGNGVLVLNRNNTYTGNTSVNAGTLQVSNLSGSATGTGTVTVASSATLTGDGIIGGAVTVNGTISPGNSVGILNTGAETWAGGGHYAFQMSDAADLAGVGYDTLNVNGAVTVMATTATKFVIDIAGVSLANFDNTSNYVWTIASAASVSGFSADKFTLNVSGFGSLGNGGFAIAQSGNNIVLKFLQKPTVTTDPVSQVATYGGGTSFSVVAAGDPVLTYQWRKDSSAISGATNPSLSLTGIHMSDAGNYDVVVSNEAGSATSAVASLAVNKASLTVAADNQTRVYGATNPVLTATFSGFVNGETLATSDITGSAALNTTADTNSTVAGGPYTITIAQGTLASSNYDFISFTNGMLTVTSGGSSILLGSSTNTIAPGSNVTFTATVGAVAPSPGLPTGSVQFLANGTNIDGLVVLTNGIASIETSLMMHGTNIISAEYAGDANYSGTTNSAVQIVNLPPQTGVASFARAPDISFKFKISDLLTNASDVDGDALTLASVSATSTNGAVISTNAIYVFYEAPATNGNATDSFVYTVVDTFGATNSGIVILTILNDNGPSVNITGLTTLADGNQEIDFAGIPGRSYLIQATGDLTPPITWTTLGMNSAGTNGLFNYIDLDATNHSTRYYRTAKP